ncbi:MAG TPA: enolase C-terminal domain-like protein [Actinomycetota bacterium]
MDVLRRVPFRVRLRVPVGAVVERAGEFVEGPAGWAEYSPLPSWSPAERARAEAAAVEVAGSEFPAPVRDRVEVNALVPRVTPREAAKLALESGCATIKVKVGDEYSIERVRAVREAMGPATKIRVDANGSWDVVTASLALAQLEQFGIEFIEDPVSNLEDMANLRRGSSVLIAAESCVRTIQDVRRMNDLRAADVLVLKPQRMGGIAASLAAAEESTVPVVPSSALETSVGLSAVLAVAAALPSLPFAAGIGTALLLDEDPVEDPLVPVDGALTPRRVRPAL